MTNDARRAAPRRPVIDDVARAAGVSRTTVSHALSGRGEVSAETKARVAEVARQLGYRPNVRAQSLRLGRAQAIALMSSMPVAVSGGPSRLGFFTEIAAAAAETALAHGVSVVLVPPLEMSDGALAHLDVDGVILVEPAADDPFAAELRTRHLPYVTIGRQQDGDPAVPAVDLRAGDGTRVLLDHLRASGARRIALMVGSSRRHAYVEAVAAYEAFCHETGHRPFVATADERLGHAAGHARTLELLAEAPEIDAVCALVDAFATGALAALRESGRRVPEDVRVATRYDGLRARTAEPPLTAIDLHLSAVAAAAVDLLLAHLAGGAASVPATVVPVPTLVPRASSATSFPSGTASALGALSPKAGASRGRTRAPAARKV